MRVDERLQPHVTNRLGVVSESLVTGIIGEAPSRFAKTPLLWNAVYRDLGWDAVSLPWDVPQGGLEGFVRAAKAAPSLAGFSVTNPYKIAILPLLDALDPLAAQIGAVNTVARRADGALVGYNTDGQGAIDALIKQLPGQAEPFMKTLTGQRVIMIGAGGAARAVAFFLGKAIGPDGKLLVVNRDPAKAVALADAVRVAYGIGEGSDEEGLNAWLATVDLVINASVKGQAGWRTLADGSACQLEGYSALGPASPARVHAGKALDAAASREWFLDSRTDLLGNADASLAALSRLAPHAACFDLVYTPLETRFLAQSRLAGHATQNGKWMNVAQAADAFAHKVCTANLVAQGVSAEAGYDRAFEVMSRVW